MTAPGQGVEQAPGQKQAVTGLLWGAGAGGQDHPGGSLGRWAPERPRPTAQRVTAPTCPSGLAPEHWLLPASTTDANTPPHKSQDLPQDLGGPGHLPCEILVCREVPDGPFCPKHRERTHHCGLNVRVPGFMGIPDPSVAALGEGAIKVTRGHQRGA